MAGACWFLRQFAKYGLALISFLLVVWGLEAVFGAVGGLTRIQFAERALEALPRSLAGVLPVAALGAGASLAGRNAVGRGALSSMAWWAAMMGCVFAVTGVLTLLLAPVWDGALARLFGSVPAPGWSALGPARLLPAYHAAVTEALRNPSWTAIGWSPTWYRANQLGWEYYSRWAWPAMVALLAPLGYCIGVWTSHLSLPRRLIARVAVGTVVLLMLLATLVLSHELCLQQRLRPELLAFSAAVLACVLLTALAWPTAVRHLHAGRA